VGRVGGAEVAIGPEEKHTHGSVLRGNRLRGNRLRGNILRGKALRGNKGLQHREPFELLLGDVRSAASKSVGGSGVNAGGSGVNASWEASINASVP